MKRLHFFYILQSQYCKIVFIFSLILGYYITPKDVFKGNSQLLAYIFLITFSITTTCLVRQTKERLTSARQATTTTIGLIANILGISALQVCGMSASFCGTSLGMTLLLTILPHSTLLSFSRFSVPILSISILIQIYIIFKSGCFKLISNKQIES